MNHFSLAAKRIALGFFLFIALYHALTRTGVTLLWTIERRIDDVLISSPNFLPSSWSKIPQLHSKVVAIDGKTLIAAGYPIKRADYADVIKTLQKAGTGPIAMDVIFGSSADAIGSQSLASSIEGSKKVTLAAISSTNWMPPQNEWGNLPQKSLLQTGDSSFNSTVKALDGPWPPISKAAHGIALTDSKPDSDGNLRWYELVHPGPGGIYPSLALSEYLLSTGQTCRVDVDKNNWIRAIRFFQGETAASTIDLSDDPAGIGRIPLKPLGRTGLLPDLSLSDFLTHDPEAIKSVRGEPIFIGTTMDGARPVQPTPLDPLQAGIHNHQSAFEALWTKKILHRGFPSRTLEILLMSALLILYNKKLKISLAKRAFYGRLYSVVCVGLKIILFKLNIWIHISSTLAAIGTLYVISATEEYDRSERNRLFLKKAFSNFLHPTLVEDLAAHPEKVSLGGEAKNVTLFFCDLRGFTTLSEGLDPRLVLKMMNQYFEVVSNEIIRFEGTIDKYIGDAVMAFWGAPVNVCDPEKKAVACSQAVLREFNGLAERWKKEFELKAMPGMGIGLHSGQAIVGNVGGKSRFNYTAMGDAVNLASRIESLTKQYGVSLLLSGETRHAVSDDVTWLKVDCVQVAGRKQSVEIFTNVDLDSKISDQYRHGFALYELGDFASAFDVFNELNFGPARLLAKRCNQLLESPPQGWLGIYSTSK